MYSVGILLGFFCLIAWLVILTVLLWKENSFLKTLFPNEQGQKEGNIKQKFEEVIAEIARFRDNEIRLKKQVERLSQDGLHHIQRVYTKRYNPFNDTGGDQSFSIALVDGVSNGVLLTSLHNRSGTRIYVKNITAGKCDIELSKEEKEVLNQVTT